MRRRKAYDGFVPATTRGGRIPADDGGGGKAGGCEEAAAAKTVAKSAVADESLSPQPLKTLKISTLKISLHYGNLCLWRVMAPAIVLHLGRVDFELVRYKQFFGEEMRRAAKAAGSGRAPWMIVNGRCLTQTSAICRFAADIAGCTPANPFLAAKVDEVVQSITDFYEIWTNITAEGFALSKGSRKRQQKIPKLLERLQEEEGPFFFNFMDKILRENDANDHAFLVGDDLTIADVALWRLVGSLSDDVSTSSPVKYWPREMTERRYPRVAKFVKRIDAHPLIRAYMIKLWPPGFAVSPFPGRGFPKPIDGKWQNMGTSLEPPDVRHVQFWAARGVVDPDGAVNPVIMA